MNRVAHIAAILSLMLVGAVTTEAAAEATNASTQPPAAEVRTSVGFFSGWFQPMELEPSRSPQEAASKHQPKSPSVPGPASPPNARDAAAMSRISPGAGMPATSSVNSPPRSSGTDAGGSRILSAIDKCQQIADLAARSHCETRARSKAGYSAELNRPTIQTDDTVDRNYGAYQ